MHGGTHTEADPDSESSSQGEEGREARQEEGRKGHQERCQEGHQGYEASYEESQEGGKTRGQKSQTPGPQGDEETLMLRVENVGGSEHRPRLQHPVPRIVPDAQEAVPPITGSSHRIPRLGYCSLTQYAG